MQELQVHHFAARDADALRTLYMTSIKANPEGFIQDLNYHGDIALFAENVQKGGGVFVVGYHAHQLVAMGALRKDAPTDSTAELCKLHVSEQCQGLGHGRALSEHLIQQAFNIGLNSIHLHVTTSQKAAIGLYKKLGFSEDNVALWHGVVNGNPVAFQTAYMHKKLV